jgi:hypothetical protein
MNKPKPDEKDEQLSKTLREWKVGASLPLRFQEDVWRQIERTAAPRDRTPLVWEAFTRWIGTMLPRPAMAVAYFAVLLTVGATAGWTQAHQTNARVKGELGERYVRALDPYQTPRN